MRDLLERSLWTGVEAGLAILTLDALTAFDATALEALQVAGIATVLTTIKVLAAGRLAALRERHSGDAL